MMTVSQMSSVTGVSIRTLQYYDNIELLRPAETTIDGHRYYNNKCLETLQLILLYREAGMPLKDIQKIVNDPQFDRKKALRQQIRLLTARKEYYENLIDLAEELVKVERHLVTFEAFHTGKLDECADEIREEWGMPRAPKRADKRRSRLFDKEKEEAIDRRIVSAIMNFGSIRETDPASETAQAYVLDLQKMISQNYFVCTDKRLSELGKRYSDEGAYKFYIDLIGGSGTAAFAAKAIEIHCQNAKQRREECSEN